MLTKLYVKNVVFYLVILTVCSIIKPSETYSQSKTSDLDKSEIPSSIKKERGREQFHMVWESRRLTDTPINLMKAADLNENGIKELIVTDFSNMGGQDKSGPTYSLYIFEKEGKAIKEKWKKTWSSSSYDATHILRNVAYLVSWKVNDKVYLEGVPPYIGLEWSKGNYIWHDQSFDSATNSVGSWVFPWVASSCWHSFTLSDNYPRECLLGVRDFSGKGRRIIVTLNEVAKGKQSLRVRRYEEGFPIELETNVDKEIYGSEILPKFNVNTNREVLLYLKNQMLALSPDYINKSYQLKPFELKFSGSIFFTQGMTYGVDPLLGHTQSKDIEEYWWYDLKETPQDEMAKLLRRVYFRPNQTNLVVEDIAFKTHPKFIDFGSFAIGDLDGDGIDEIALIEHTGDWKRPFPTSDSIEYANVANYIQVLKWDGKTYSPIWISSPFKEFGSQLMIEDVMGRGKNQLIAGTAHGTVQIWEKE